MKKEELADLIFRRIYVDGPFTFDELEARAIEKGIDIDLFYAAMEIVNRHRKLKVTGKKYAKRVPRAMEATSHTTWVRDNYPAADPMMGIHAIFVDYDTTCSCQLTATGDELKEMQSNGTHVRNCNLHPKQREILREKYAKIGITI